MIGLRDARSEEHTSELQSLTNLVCRLLLEKKKLGSTGTTWKGSSRRSKKNSGKFSRLSALRTMQARGSARRHTVAHTHGSKFFLMIRPPPGSTPLPSTVFFQN